MRTVHKDQFGVLLKEAGVPRRLQKEVRLAAPEAWGDRELVGNLDRAGSKGVLLLEPYNELYLVAFDLSRRIVDSRTGRSQPIICDFCMTWQPGSNGARITFSRGKEHPRVTYLCCGDLDCSSHVRSKTKASAMSRTQLHEDLTDQQRVDRLKARLQQLVHDLGLSTVRP